MSLWRKDFLVRWQSEDTGWPPVQCRVTPTVCCIHGPFCVLQNNGELVQSSPLTSMTQYRGIFVQVTVHVELVACQSSRAAPDRWPRALLYFNPSLSLLLFYPGSQFVVFRFHGWHNLSWSVPRLGDRKCNHSSFSLLSQQKLGFGFLHCVCWIAMNGVLVHLQGGPKVRIQ